MYDEAEQNVRCNWCMWTGTERELRVDAETDREHCPNCHESQYLMDLPSQSQSEEE